MDGAIQSVSLATDGEAAQAELSTATITTNAEASARRNRFNEFERNRVVASEQASAIRASDFTTMCFIVVHLSPSIQLFDVRQLPKSRLVILYWARRIARPGLDFRAFFTS
jgi:hypothetical protein